MGCIHSICREVWDQLGAPNESPPSGKEQASARAAREGRGRETANSGKNCKSMQPRTSPGRSPGNPTVSQLVFCLLYNTAYMERFTVRHSVPGRFVNTRRLLKWEQTRALYSEQRCQPPSWIWKTLKDRQRSGELYSERKEGGQTPGGLDCRSLM